MGHRHLGAVSLRLLGGVGLDLMATIPARHDEASTSDSRAAYGRRWAGRRGLRGEPDGGRGRRRTMTGFRRPDRASNRRGFRAFRWGREHEAAADRPARATGPCGWRAPRFATIMSGEPIHHRTQPARSSMHPSLGRNIRGSIALTGEDPCDWSETSYAALKSLIENSGSCPRGWCKSGVVFALSGGFSRSSQAATAGSVRIGSSLNGAMVSRVM
jgi:hypothetical protein